MGDLLDATAGLMAVPSVSGHEGVLADRVERMLRSCDWLEVTRLGDNVVARTSLGRSQRLVLAGHLDTVPPDGNAEPRARRGHRVGRRRVRHEGRSGRHARRGHHGARAGDRPDVVLLRPRGGRSGPQRPARAVAPAARPAGGRRGRSRRADERAGRSGLPGHHAGARSRCAACGRTRPVRSPGATPCTAWPRSSGGWRTGRGAR